MTKSEIILDTAMCILWMITYTLVLIGTIKYRYPLIAPETQVATGAFEFSSAVLFFSTNLNSINYAVIAYLYWTLIEIVIFGAIIGTGYLKREQIVLYLGTAVLVTAIMIYLVAIRGHMLFFSYINTMIGELFWVRFILKKDYPMKPIALMVFLAKFLADILGAVVYFGDGGWVVDVVSIMLPILDLMFILVYIRRKTAQKRKTT